MNDQRDDDKRRENSDSTALDTFYTELGQTYQSIAESAQPPIAKLGLFATRSLQLFETRQDHFAENPETMIGPFTGNHHSWLSIQCALFAETIGNAVTEGKLRPIDTERAGMLFLNAIFGLMLRRVHLDVAESIEDDVRGLIDIFLNGLTRSRIPVPVKPA